MKKKQNTVRILSFLIKNLRIFQKFYFTFTILAKNNKKS